MDKTELGKIKSALELHGLTLKEAMPGILSGIASAAAICDAGCESHCVTCKNSCSTGPDS
jgi:hypothetical protein